ncbi:hypothetical protein P4507_001515 [Enterococcus faecalis]|nr:hypothetical protein [Enterococcus faecalis]
MINGELETVSLSIIKSYFLGIREIQFPTYQKQFKQIDLALFIKLADFMENLTDFETSTLLREYLKDLEKTLNSYESGKYSQTVQQMIRDMEEEIRKIV